MPRRRRQTAGEGEGPPRQRRRIGSLQDSDRDEIELNPTRYVDEFVAYCKRHVRGVGGEAQESLKKLLCRSPGPGLEAPQHFEGLREESHVGGDGDEDSKMARIANAIRHHFQGTGLLEDVRDRVLSIPGWDENFWDTGNWNCRCKTCPQHLGAGVVFDHHVELRAKCVQKIVGVVGIWPI